MRLLELPLLLVGVVLPTGCFEEPPAGTSGSATGDSSSGTGNNPGTTTDNPSTAGTTFGETTFGTTFGTTLDTTPGTTFVSGPSETTDGPPMPLLLFPRTCTMDTIWWTADRPLDCGARVDGPFLDTHPNYDLGGAPLERVIEVRPPPLGAVAVDGFFEIDTSGFTNPVLRSQVACVTDSGCRIDFNISSELSEEVQSKFGGSVMAGGPIVEVNLNRLPVARSLMIHLNVNAPDQAGESRFLWIDPRVVEAP